MNANYLSQIENAPMKRRLLRVENLPIMEDLLARESQRLERLKKLKKEGKLNLGDKVSSGELRELFPQICREVDDFLGIQNGEVPKFGYYSLFRPGLKTTPVLFLYTLSASQIAEDLTALVMGININPQNFLMDASLFAYAVSLHLMAKSPSYNHFSKFVTLERTVRTYLIPAAAHEYTHDVQQRNGILRKECSIFNEGQARGIERQLAEMYRDGEDNEAFLYGVLDRDICEIKSVYRWVCKKLGKQPRESILKTKSSRDGDESFRRFIMRKPTSHAIGNSLFSIYEASNGKGIYNQMIQGKFQFT